MMKTTGFFCFLILLSVACGQDHVNQVPCPGVGDNAFQKNCIVPDLVAQAPKEVLKVQYLPSGLTLQNGNELKPEDVKDAPSAVQWTSTSYDGILYTLSKSDPDASSRQSPTRAPINHWLIVNIRGNDLSSGDLLMPYGGARPPNGTGLHRYVFMVFKQAGRIDVTDLRSQFSPTNRTKFEIKNFAAAHNLDPQPLAGNFYQAKWSEFLAVPAVKIT
ncbi:putative OV-16 antigen [Hypsibius exemplaris]|uniref:OV-16 antigen n=1 Tax=Hypsibius exemplaris TaxID=2072580 RepID=A0A1W0X8D9_HYPEX|nr:putative OV-16 antigen [Hypsibius exemplaris]